MLVCPLCRLVLGDNETTCPRDGHEGIEARQVDVPAAVRARFSIVEAYAQGDSGDLYLADDQQTGRRGVLKMLRPPPNATPAEKARLKRELVKQSTLTHPSLSVPLATGEEKGVLWLFREWHEGVSLRVKLTRGGALPVAEALSITSQIAAALDELHRSGLLHRDIEPGHVLIKPQPSGLPRVTLIDAGIAGRIETGGVFDVMGTPEYCSPEQAKGKLVSFRSDLYALGCVLFEMLTGTPPFSGTPAELLSAHAEQTAPTPQMSMPTGVSTLLMQLLAKEPRERPFSAQQVRRALEPLLPQSPNDKREATQTFERLSEKRRAPVSGRGTLRPPSSTKIGMPAAVPRPSQPPSGEPPGNAPPSNASPSKAPPGKAPPSEAPPSEAPSSQAPTKAPPSETPSSQAPTTAPRSSHPPSASRTLANRGADPTEELSALDLEEAEQIVAQAAAAADRPPATAPRDRTVELSALDLEQAEQVLAPAPRDRTVELSALDLEQAEQIAATDRTLTDPERAPDPAPPWQQTQIADGPADDTVADADAVERDAPRAGPSTSRDTPAPRPEGKRELVTAAALTSLVGACGIFSLIALSAVWFGSDDDAAAVAASPEAEPPRSSVEPPPGLDAPQPAEPEPAAAASEGAAAPSDEPPQPAETTSAEAARLERFDGAREEALTHFRARRFGRAAAAYQRATELDPQHAGSFSGLGAARLAQGRAASAVRAYRRAVELQPDHAGYHAALGQAYVAAGDRRRARRSFTRALELDPSNRAAREGLDRL